ncbi:sensor histidine kinase [Actinoplanes palleronii]|nr:histidine kinase [Actinoplanes palleronii]
MWSPSRRALLVDLVVSGAVTGLAVWWWHQFPLGGFVYGVLAGVALMWRRRRPVLVLALVAALTAAAAPVTVHGSQLHEGMLLITIAVATHAAVAHTERLRTGVLTGLAAVLLGTALMVGRTWLEFGDATLNPQDVAGMFGVVFSYGAVVWAAGLGIRALRQQRLFGEQGRASAEREGRHLARIAVVEERARIARELHDIVAHSLSVMVLQANGAAYVFDRDPERAREALRAIGSTGSEALEEIKQLVRILRSDSEDLTDRSPVGLGQLDAVVERARGAGLPVELEVEGAPPEMPGGVVLAVYRIVQESLTNTIKHAGAGARAVVHVHYRPESVEVTVTDSGDRPGAVTPGGHGVIGMRERVNLYSGTFAAGPHAGGGWQVRALIPLADVAVAR